MKSSEFIQAAAALLGSMGSEQPQQELQPNRAVLTPAEPEHEEGDDINTHSMVGPLQQKLELLKKAVDVDNIYDSPERAGAPDEVDDIKRLAGVMFNADDDNDVVG
jgi:hypothetical protein